VRGDTARADHPEPLVAVLLPPTRMAEPGPEEPVSGVLVVLQRLLVHFPPTVTLTQLVNSLKGVSSRLLRKEFEDLRGAYWRGVRLWSGSYSAGSVGGAPLSVVQEYIQQQTHPSR